MFALVLAKITPSTGLVATISPLLVTLTTLPPSAPPAPPEIVPALVPEIVPPAAAMPAVPPEMFPPAPLLKVTLPVAAATTAWPPAVMLPVFEVMLMLPAPAKITLVRLQTPVMLPEFESVMLPFCDWTAEPEPAVVVMPPELVKATSLVTATANVLPVIAPALVMFAVFPAEMALLALVTIPPS